MNEPSNLDRTFHIIMRRMVETGQAPHYTEIAAELGVAVEEGRKALHEISQPGSLDGSFPIPISLLPSLRLTTFPPSIALPSMVSRNGSASEDLNRWRSAGFFLER